MDREEDDDVPNIVRQLDALLKEKSAGSDARFNFVDARGAADACRIAGSYVVDGDKIKVRFKVKP